MPKGDKEILKADIEDGFGKISNLLMEALTLAKMNGTKKSICLFIIRRTYFWNKKFDEIKLKDMAQACGSTKAHISTQLNKLIEEKVVLRENYKPGKVPMYSINTTVSQWDKGIVNTKQLNKNITEGLYKHETEGFRKCETVNTAQSIEKPIVTDTPKDSSTYMLNTKDTITTITGEEDADSNPNNFGGKDIDKENVSEIQNRYLKLTKRFMCNAKDIQNIIKNYKLYKDKDFIISVMEQAFEENIKRYGKSTINSFNFFTNIFKDQWEKKKILESSSISGDYSPGGKSKEIDIPYQEIIEYLNLKTDKNYKPDTSGTKGLINTRWAEGFRLENFKKVIDTKVAKWKGSKYEDFLRPETLFSDKFESYLNENMNTEISNKDNSNNKPKSKNSFHNFESRTEKYSASELEAKVLNKHKNKLKGEYSNG